MSRPIRTEVWSGHEIRFVWHKDEWWAVLKDITKALSLNPKWVNQRLSGEVVSNNPMPDRFGRIQKMLIVNEFGIYETIFSSRKPEAKAFKNWVYSVIKELRRATGLEGFQVFRMLDKEHQKEAMAKLKEGLKSPAKVDFIKANTITNKAVSNLYGLSKMAKKDEMTPEMLIRRQPILEDTVELMAVVNKFGLDCSVSQKIYERHRH